MKGWGGPTLVKKAGAPTQMRGTPRRDQNGRFCNDRSSSETKALEFPDFRPLLPAAPTREALGGGGGALSRGQAAPSREGGGALAFVQKQAGSKS